MIETITNSVFLAGALAGAALIGLAWLIFSKSSEHLAEIDRLTDQKKNDASRILKLDDEIRSLKGTVSGHETANAALTKDKAAAELALVEMREKFDSQEVDNSALSDEVDKLKKDLIKAQGAVTEANDEALPRLMAAEDAYLDLKLIDLKGAGKTVVEKFRKAKITMRQLAIMPKVELNDLLDKAMVPKVARKYDLQKQAKKIIADMERITRK